MLLAKICAACNGLIINYEFFARGVKYEIAALKKNCVYIYQFVF